MSKYKSIKVTMDGITFDSKKEAHRYSELKMLEKAGIISELELQTKFTLIPSQYTEVNGKRKCVERECSYIADFTYMKDGKLVVEDVKGYRDPQSAAYAKFTIKRKMMRYMRGIEITEV